MNSAIILVALVLGVASTTTVGRIWYAGDPDLSIRNAHRLANADHKVCQKAYINATQVFGIELWGKDTSDLLVSFRNSSSISSEITNVTVPNGRFRSCGMNGEYSRYQAVFTSPVSITAGEFWVCIHFTNINLDDQRYYVVAKVGDDKINAVGTTDDGTILYQGYQYTISKASSFGLWGSGIVYVGNNQVPSCLAEADTSNTCQEFEVTPVYSDWFDCLKPQEGSKVCFDVSTFFNNFNETGTIETMECTVSECLDGDVSDLSRCREVNDESQCTLTKTGSDITACFLQNACPDQIVEAGSKCVRTYDVSLTTNGCRYGPFNSRIVVPASGNVYEGYRCLPDTVNFSA